MTLATETKSEKINAIAEELKLNLRQIIVRSRSTKSCDTFVKAFLEQLANDGFSKSSIRKVIPKAIKEVKENLGKVRGASKLQRTTTKDGKTYEQHYALEKLYSELDRFGLLYGNEKGSFDLDELNGVESKQKTEVKKSEVKIVKKQAITTNVGDLKAIDFTKYLELANKLLESSEWEERLIGVLMVIPRRGVEVGLQMNFYEHDEYSIVVSTPVKKRDEKDTYYLVPCFVHSRIICESIEFIRNNKPKLKSDSLKAFGNLKEANEAFNNDEESRLLPAFNEHLRPFLSLEASTKGRDNLHQLKNIGTTALTQLKADSLGGLVGNKEIIDEWVRQASAHVSSQTTGKYVDWLIANIPERLRAVVEVEPKQVPPEFVGEEVKIKGGKEVSELFTKLLTLAGDDEGKLKTVEALFLDDKKELKDIETIATGLNEIIEYVSSARTRQDAIHKALNIPDAPKSSNEEKVEQLTEAMIIHNRENPNQKIFISDSTIRGFFDVFPGKNGKGAAINILLVRKIISQNQHLRDVIDRHNDDNQITQEHNLTWRKEKSAIRENLKRILQEQFNHELN